MNIVRSHNRDSSMAFFSNPFLRLQNVTYQKYKSMLFFVLLDIFADVLAKKPIYHPSKHKSNSICSNFAN